MERWLNMQDAVLNKGINWADCCYPLLISWTLLATADLCRKTEAEQCIMMAAKIIAPAIDANYTDGYDWCIEQVKSSKYLELAHSLDIDKAIGFLKQKDFQQVTHVIYKRYCLCGNGFVQLWNWSTLNPLLFEVLVFKHRSTFCASETNQFMLVVPLRAYEFAERSFSGSCLAFWNSILVYLRSSTSVDIFKSRLKSHI